MYRSPAEEKSRDHSPRWPALIGLRVVVGNVVSRRGLRLGWRWLCIITAFLLMPLSLALHGLRNLGGAEPEREDAASVAVRAWDVDGRAQPGPLVAAIISVVMFLVIVASTLSAVLTR